MEAREDREFREVKWHRVLPPKDPCSPRGINLCSLGQTISRGWHPYVICIHLNTESVSFSSIFRKGFSILPANNFSLKFKYDLNLLKL